MPVNYRFDLFRFDPTSGELSGPGGTQRLEPQPARVLEHLLARTGELVSRDELKRDLWADSVVDFDQGINYCVRQIRVALGEDAAQPRFIETLPRRGYRFVAPVQQEAAPLAGPQDAPAPPRRGAGRELALALAIVMLAITAFWFGPASRVAERRKQQDLEREAATDALMSPAGRAAGRVLAPRPLRLAVLALDIPPDEATAASLQRLLEDLVAEFTTIDAARLGVVGPVTTGPFAGTDRPHTEVGAQLGVDYVLSVREDPEGAFAQLIAVPGGEHLFATRFAAGTEATAMAQPIAAGVLAAIEKAADTALR